MSFLGALFGPRPTYTPPPTPAASGKSGEAPGQVKKSDSNGSGESQAGSSQTTTATSTAAPASTAQSSSSAQASSTSAQGASAGTPVDSSPVRIDFSSRPPVTDEDSARAAAIAAQARERVDNIVENLGKAPAPSVKLVDGDKVAATEETGANDTFKALRGQDAAGAKLDRVA